MYSIHIQKIHPITHLKQGFIYLIILYNTTKRKNLPSYCKQGGKGQEVIIVVPFPLVAPCHHSVSPALIGGTPLPHYGASPPLCHGTHSFHSHACHQVVVSVGYQHNFQWPSPLLIAPCFHPMGSCSQQWMGVLLLWLVVVVCCHCSYPPCYHHWVLSLSSDSYCCPSISHPLHHCH